MSKKWEELDIWERERVLTNRAPRVTRGVAGEGAVGSTSDLKRSLCGRCHHGMVARTAQPETIIARCTWSNMGDGGVAVPTNIVECTKFEAVRHEMSLTEMTGLAVLVDVRPNPGGYL